MAARSAAKKNTDEKSAPRRGPIRDARGRVSGGNPGNSGGKKGRSGRKPLAFKLFCADVLEDAETQEEVRRAAQDRTTPGYGSLIKTLAGYHVGLPTQPIGGDPNAPLVVRVVREGA